MPVVVPLSVEAGSAAGAVAVAVAVAVAGAKAIKSLEKRYNSRSIFMILGMTSTLGLILGGVLGWLLKLQSVS